MLAAVVRTFIALQPCFCGLSITASSSPGQESSPWFVGCFTASSIQLFESKGACDLDPVTCSKRCLDEGYQFAALSSETCYCSNQLHGLVVSGCVNTSFSERTIDVRGGSERQRAFYLPLGNVQDGNVALYRTEGPFLYNISMSVSPDKVHAGMSFLVTLYGNLAGRPTQPTDFCVSNWLSTLSSTLHLSVLQLPLGSLAISLLHGPLGVPSCIPFTHLSPNSVPVEAVYQGKSVTLQAYSWMFDTEGLHTVSVNASSAHGWTQETVVVNPVASNLRLNVSGGQMTCGENISVGVELFTTMTHQLVLKVAFEAENNEDKEDLCRTEPLNSGNLSWKQGNICWHGGISDSHHLHLLHVFNPSSCTLRLDLSCRLPAAAGEYRLEASIYSSTDPPSVLLSTVLPQTLKVYEPICILRPSDKWSGTVAIELRAENKVSCRSKSVRICVEGKRKLSPQAKINPTWQPSISQSSACSMADKAVRIYAEKQAYPTNADIIFLAVADIQDHVEFLWDFGDSVSVKTTSRTTTKKYHNPGSYNVVVVASYSQMSITSDVFPLVVQRAVKLNRLVHKASVLFNQMVMVSCRVNVGTDLSFLWKFGDGTTRQGESTVQHVFHRIGEFRVEVNVSNVVSWASLSSYIFVVDQPCQPPPVKNMGPLKIQVRRHEVVRLGVTLETEVDCDTPVGLNYTWTLFDSAGQTFPLPSTDTHKQSLILQSHLLQYDTYTAIARVQVINSVVYSNYTVRVQVIPSPPVASIQGGTNIFIDKKSNKLVTLNGQTSFDPDFPLSPLSYSWTCKPVSLIPSSCFNQSISTSSPVLKFPASLLQDNFDQFKFTLTVQNGERSASLETFLTVTSDLIRTVSITCPQCRGDHVNWDQSFSVSAMCDDCNTPEEFIQYTWSLYLVNASSKPFIDVPFCHTVDLLTPSTIVENPAASTLTLGISNLLDDAFDYDLADRTSSNKGRGRLNVTEEGDPGMSAGRLTGAERFSPEDDSTFDPALHKVEGSNLVNPRPLVVLHKPSLLDLHRDSIHRELFESYTYAGISSPLLRLRPFNLRPRSIYMFEVTAKSKDIFLGRNQLFLKTSPVPKGMICQVQPVKGMELYTHFSIFCTSGREDLLYEYSFSIGGRAPRILYQGRDFQHYFSLPSGDPSDDYKVTIYTEIRSSTYGSATKPCPVTVQVKPSFLRNTSSSSRYDPDLKLSELGLRNLSALVQLGNSVEIRNYISLLSSILNRLSLDAEANTHAQMHMRNVLICCVCELKISEQVSAVDSIFILNDLLKFTSQVTLMSARKITSYVQAVSKQFPRSSASDSYHGNQKMLNSLVNLLSYDLKVVTSCDYTFKTPKSADDSQAFESGLPTDKNIKDFEENPSRCLLDPSIDPQVNQGGSVLIEEGMQLVDDILRTASDVLLRYIFFYETKELRVNSDYITLNAAFQQKSSTYIHSGSTSFYMPASLIRLLFVRHSGRAQPRAHQPCVLRVLTELTHSPYTWAKYPAQTSGPVVDLSLYKCSTRRKIHIHSLSQPISIELQQPQKNMSSLSKYILLRSKVNYHNFSITQEHLQQAIQVTVVLNSPPNKAFPIMLLFRMFERPVPSTHHLHKIHRWENNTTRITLLPSYFNAAGVGHLALLDADFENVPRRKHQSEQISYSLTVDSSQCLSWDGQQGAWTHHGCRTQQVDTTSLVNCSCYQLRPLTVFWQQIQSSHDTTDLDPFLSVPSDLTVLGVLILCLCLYMPGLAWCRRADAISEANQRVHYLSDNSPTDQYLYAVTVHTGLCSAACMSAKVYIMLYGEDGSSQTRELQVQGSSLFRRNSQDTFILSAADSLGPLWGVHIWHDNSGPSPDWYLKLVEVSEVNKGHVKLRSWMFVSQCWLAVNKGDGRVERMLLVGTHGISFSKILFLKLFDYLADLHIWMSVYSCPVPNSFTHTQRLGVCALLLLGYACANAVIISQTDDQLPFKIGIVDLSAASITSGLISVAAVLPAATLISFLFRLRGIKLAGSGVRHANGRMTDDCLADTFPMNDNKVEPHLSRSDPQQWLQETWRMKYQDIELLSVSTTTLENKDSDEEFIIQPDVVMRKEDDLALRSSVGPVLQTFLQIPEWSNCDYIRQSNESELLTEGWKFNGNQRAARDEGQTFLQERGFGLTSLWCHHVVWVLCVLLSLCCLLFSAVLGLRFSSSKILLWIHALFVSLMSCIFFIQPAVILAVAVTVSCWYKNKTDIQIFSSKLWSQDSADQPKEQVEPTAIPQKTSSYTEELLRARQRSRYLRFVRPPTPARLRKSREKKRRESLICKTLRDLSLFGSMLLLMMCISYDSSFKEHYHLNRAVTRHFIRNHNNVFMSIKNHEDWWNWTQTSLLHLLYQNTSAKTTLHIVIGDPIVQKTETLKPFQSQVPMVTPPRTYDHSGFYSEAVTSVGLGRTKSDAASQLTHLRLSGWLGRQTVALRVQFTLYSPAPNLFTSVTLLTEQSPSGVLLPSAKVQSVRVYHSPAGWDYVVLLCKLLFFLVSLLLLCNQMSTIAQQGLMGSWKTPCTWVEVSLLITTLVYYVCSINHSNLIVEVVELLQRHNRRHVDVSFLATSEQLIRTLQGVILFLLTIRSLTVLRVNRTVATSAAAFAHSLTSVLWPMIAGLILLVLLFCLLYGQSSWTFSSIPRSLQMLLCRHMGLQSARGLLHSGPDFSYWAVLYLSSIVLWTAMVIGVMSSLVKMTKRSQSRRNVLTIADLLCYIRQRIFEFTGQQRQTGTDNHDEGRTYFLEEFESLVDELLFRLNALSNSLHRTLPPKAHYYREKDSPAIPSTPESTNMDTQDFMRSQTVNKPTRVSDKGQTSAGSCLFGFQFEHDNQKALHQRGQMVHNWQSICEAADDILKIKDCLTRPKSRLIKRLWTEDVHGQKAELCTKANGTCKLSKAHAEMVVEVLVHKEPGRGESDMF
ncbi:polycystic kidney disease 1 like 1 [Melanotaenia boesemani]|uniref:polycystic kidney disease 1 like 1 n=1 Tax=Melanotaenia boesemani TaxID=1250792 RepID=UPI001C05A46A|nr:polycystic kidney disease 1 like 1 [Melanotaenia boesemani]